MDDEDWADLNFLFSASQSERNTFGIPPLPELPSIPLLRLSPFVPSSAKQGTFVASLHSTRYTLYMIRSYQVVSYYHHDTTHRQQQEQGTGAPKPAAAFP